MKNLLLPLVVGLLPASLSAQLVINEFLADPPAGDDVGDANGDGVRGGTDDEFIEFVNTSQTAVDIENWTITDGSGLRHTFVGSTLVEAGQALLIFGGGAPTGAFGGALVVTADSGLSLNNSGDEITLFDGAGVEVASHTYGDEANNNTSLNLDPDLTGADFVEHSSLGDGSFIFSPGTRSDGDPFVGDGLTLMVDLVSFSEGAGAGAASGTVTRTGDLSAVLTVEILSSDLTELTVPATVDILAGSGSGVFSGSFDVVVEDDEVFVFPSVFLNEIRIDESSTDLNEFFELYTPTMGTSLERISLVVLGDGSASSGLAGGVVEAAIDLSGQSSNGNYFLVGEDTMTIATPDLTTGLNFENGDNVTFLLVGDFTGSVGDDLDTNEDGILDVEPWGVVLDGVALIEEANPPVSTEYEYATGLGFPTVGPFLADDFVGPPPHTYLSVDGTWVVGLVELSEDTPSEANPDGGPPADEQIEIVDFNLAVGDGSAEIVARGLGSKVWKVQRSEDLGDTDAWVNLSVSVNESDNPDGTTSFRFSETTGGDRQFYRLVEE